ncbi:MAG: isochorismatase family protein, partial [Planctomycetota bacterium]
RDDTVLLVVDMQERLVPVVRNADRLVWNIGRLLQGARVLGVPALATEQYPRGLGATLPDIAAGLRATPDGEAETITGATTDAITGAITGATTSATTGAISATPSRAIPDKLTFSAYGCAAVRERLAALGRPNVLVCGIETHVCVLQTVLDLGHAGYRVFLAEDAVESRFESDRLTALRRMEAAGSTLTTVESALFEWCFVAGTPEFKQVSQLVKQTFG